MCADFRQVPRRREGGIALACASLRRHSAADAPGGGPPTYRPPPVTSRIVVPPDPGDCGTMQKRSPARGRVIASLHKKKATPARGCPLHGADRAHRRDDTDSIEQPVSCRTRCSAPCSSVVAARRRARHRSSDRYPDAADPSDLDAAERRRADDDRRPDVARALVLVRRQWRAPRTSRQHPRLGIRRAPARRYHLACARVSGSRWRRSDWRAWLRSAFSSWHSGRQSIMEAALQGMGVDASTARDRSAWIVTAVLWLAASTPLWLGPVGGPECPPGANGSDCHSRVQPTRAPRHRRRQ